MAILAVIYSRYNTTTLALERDNKTSAALQKAKEALIYYSLNNSYLNSPGCGNSNCPRPGDLPCPDRTNDGTAETSCGNAAGNNQTFRLNRLPLKTLGLEDLADGYGEHLWYAVSNSYKYNTRTRPLNSDTVGTITIRDSTGKVINDATTGGGVVAVIFSPGNAITRQDSYIQNRDATGVNTAKNYLDIVSGVEDNSDFVDGSNSNGFIIGPVKDATGNVIVNDRFVVITRDEMAAAMESYVLAQVRQELLTYYNSNFYYPYPAAFNDATCIAATNANINSGCNSIITTYGGRIPVSNLNQLGSTWLSTSILKGQRSANWFQQNLWRELIYYAIAPDCEIIKPNCSGAAQRLTLNNALLSPVNNKNVVVVSAGKTINTQSRTTKTSVVNYLEGENASPSDYIYSRSTAINNSFNDRAMSIP